jgi:CDP-glucose 4,6-dehydratase
VLRPAESGRAFVETDPLGGHDPYSASKACSEIVAASVRDSFLRGTKTTLSTLRAGNVIGGADWAEDRLLPDCTRAFAAGRPAVIRNPRSIRPWQHVLDPLAAICGSRRGDPSLAGAWNWPRSRSGDGLR